jgi:hypothetical protein
MCLGHSERIMRHRDLIIRVYGPFPDMGYVRLAHQIGSHLVAEGLDAQAVLVTDGTITAADVATAASDTGRSAAVVARSARETTGADGQCVGQAAGVGQGTSDADD